MLEQNSIRISVEILTAIFPDVEHISDDGVGDFGRGLSPRELQGGFRQSRGFQTLRGIRKILGRRDSETGTGLVSAGSVFSDALIYRLIF